MVPKKREENCGCEHVIVNGKWIHILCEEHEMENRNFDQKRVLRKISKKELYYD